MPKPRNFADSLLKQFGFYPPFFEAARETPALLEPLFQQASAALASDQISVLTKAKLLAYMCRSSSAESLLVFHIGRLHALGMEAGEIFKLLAAPLPPAIPGDAIQQIASSAPLKPAEPLKAEAETLLLQATDWLSLGVSGSAAVAEAMRGWLGTELYAHWVALAGFASTCRVWAAGTPNGTWERHAQLKQEFEQAVKEDPGLAAIASRGAQAFELSASVESPLEQNAADSATPESYADLLISMLDRTSDFVCIASTTGQMLFLNRTARQLLGIGEDEDVSAIPLSAAHPEWAFKHVVLPAIAHAYERGVWTGEATLIAKDGREIPCSHVILTHKDASGAVRYLSAVGRDITAQKRVEESLRESERRLRALTENSQDGVALVDAAGKICYTSPSCSRILGIAPSELMGRRLLDLVHPEDVESVTAAIEAITSVPGRLGQISVRTRHGSGEWRFVEAQCKNLLHDPILRALVVNYRDISERFQAERALRDSEERFRLLIEKAPIGIRLTRDDTLLYANSAYIRQFGYRDFSELAGKSVLELVTQRDRAAVAAWTAARAKGEGAREMELWCLRKDGAEFPVHIAMEPIQLPGGQAVVSFVTDMTQRQALEERLRQAQRMESIGKLAGGIAHDFNNLLTVIRGHCEFLLDSQDISSSDKECAQEISAASERGSNLTKQLLTFSRRQPIQPVPLHLNAVVRSTVKMLERVTQENIRIQMNLAADLPMVKADQGLMDQVLINLVVNARDAMPQGGVVTLSTQGILLDPRYSAKNPEAYGGKFVRLRVSDTGAGIPPENLSRIYEPFFTTKKAGHGTGLGLATVYGAVKQHRGWIEVSSQIGEGTSFDVFIPASEGDQAACGGQESDTAIGGSDTILVVEDETSLRRLLCHALRKHGYEVLEAESPTPAQEIWRTRSKDIAMVITDIVMPGPMNGWGLAKSFLGERPDLKVIFMSGYFGNLPQELELEEANFIRKPFVPKELLRRMRFLLDPK